MALLEARNLVKQYGQRVVVDKVSLDVDYGEVVGLLGPNGAGKTTTFRMAVGMIAPKSGRVTFNGKDITRMPMYQRARLGLGYLAQDTSVFRKLTVEQNLYAIMELMTTRRGKPYRSSGKERKRRVAELLGQFGLTELHDKPSTTLSGGERRRLEIARCLVSEPMLIMLDEPFTGIDPKTVGDIQQIVLGLRDTGIGVLITDHHFAETLRITNRGYVIAGGQLLSEGPPMHIVNDPKVREVYLGEHFNPAAIMQELRSANSYRPLLDSVAINDLIGRLSGPDHAAAAEKIRERGDQARDPLLVAMNWNNPAIRARAHAVLCEITRQALPFDPHADELSRQRQIAYIRDLLNRRKAG